MSADPPVAKLGWNLIYSSYPWSFHLLLTIYLLTSLFHDLPFDCPYYLHTSYLSLCHICSPPANLLCVCSRATDQMILRPITVPTTFLPTLKPLIYCLLNLRPVTCLVPIPVVLMPVSNLFSGVRSTEVRSVF